MKRRVSFLLLVMLVCVQVFSGCSTKKMREIKGASEDARKLVAVLEEPQHMKGASFEITAKTQGYNGKATVTFDKKGNLQVSLTAKGRFDGASVDGELGTVSIINDTLYVDLSSAYKEVKKALGDKFQNVLSEYDLTEKELKSMLVLSMPLKDVTIPKWDNQTIKEIVNLCMDCLAIAVTDEESLSAKDDTYTIKVSGKEVTSLMAALVDELSDNTEELYDMVLELAEDLEPADSAEAFMRLMLDGMKDMSKKYDDLKEMFDETEEKRNEETISEVRTEIKESMKTLKEGKDSVIEGIDERLTELRRELINERVPEAIQVKLTVEDEKKGYTLKLKESASDTTVQVTVTEYTDTLKAPEGAKNIFELLAPQFIRYVQKARVATDDVTLRYIVNAAEFYLEESDERWRTGDKVVVRVIPSQKTVKLDTIHDDPELTQQLEKFIMLRIEDRLADGVDFQSTDYRACKDAIQLVFVYDRGWDINFKNIPETSEFYH